MNNQVLVIDDSLPIHKLVESHLSDGVCCIAAFDGQKGLELAESEQPGLVLLDIDLPDVNGFEIYSQLRSNPRTAQIPVIFLTADMQSQDKARGMELGAVGYITKPCNFFELKSTVSSALRVRRVSDKNAMRDFVTGLRNQAYLQQHMESLITLARKTGHPLSCITADIDGLGRINKKYGRDVGDQVLRTVGEIFSSQCRNEDIVCYCQGGRFARICWGVNRFAASNVANHLGEQVRNKTASIGEFQVQGTCCFGIADIAIADGNSLFERASCALRRAKENGIDCISVARPNRPQKIKVTELH